MFGCATLPFRVTYLHYLYYNIYIYLCTWGVLSKVLLGNIVRQSKTIIDIPRHEAVHLLQVVYL